MTVVTEVTAKVVTQRVRRALRKRELALVEAHPATGDGNIPDGDQRHDNCFRWNIVDTATGRIILEKVDLREFASAIGVLPYWEVCPELPGQGPGF